MDSWKDTRHTDITENTTRLGYTDNEVDALVENVSVEDLLTTEGRLQALALIAIKGMRGVYNEKMAVKSGLPVPVLEHDLSSAVRAIAQINAIQKESEVNNAVYNLTVITE